MPEAPPARRSRPERARGAATREACETADVLDSRYSWLRLAITLVIATVGNVGIWAIIVIMPAVQEEFGTGRGANSLPYALTMTGFALGNLLFGRVVDRYGIAGALIGAAMANCAGFALAAASPTAAILAALHFLIGFSAAAGFGPLIADISLWFRRRRGIAVGISASGNYLSGAIWPLFIGDMLESSSWRAIYLLIALACPAIMVPLALLLRRRAPQEAKARVDIVAQANARSTGLSPLGLQLLLGLAGICCCVAMSMPQVHIVSLCVDLGYGPVVGAEMLSLMLLGGVASRLISGALADRLGGVRTLLIGSILQCVALMLYLPSNGLASLYVVSLVFGLSQGGIVPSYAVIVREYMPAGEAGARVGFVLMMTIFGMAIGGWMSGWIYDVTGSYAMAFLNGIAWNFVNIAIMLGILFGGSRRTPLPA